MYQTTKTTTRRMAAKRSAPVDENAVPITVPVKQAAAVTAALPAKLPRRSALGDKSDAYLNQRPNAETKIAKPTTTRTTLGGRLTIPSTKPVDTAKLPSVLPPRKVPIKGTTANVKATKPVRTTRASAAMASARAAAARSRQAALEKSYTEDAKMIETADKENIDTLVPATEKLNIPVKRRAAATPMDLDNQRRAPALNRANFKLLLQQEQEDSKEPLHVHEYSEDIFDYMRELEKKMMPDADYMDRQPEIQWHMRGILIDWLVQVHSRFSMLGETLFLCVNYIDRFLSTKVVSLQKLQLVGITALLLAAKYEEISAPTIADLVYMVDKGYDADEIKRAERYMIQMLKFDMGHPGPMSFLRRCSKADNYDQQSRTLAKYLIEATIMDEKFLSYPSSAIAAAGHMLAREMLNKGEWTQLHVHFSGYAEHEISHVGDLMIKRVQEPTLHQSIYDKYADRKFMKASIFVQQWLQKNEYI